MLANPHIGKLVKVWYRKENRHLQFHNKRGFVLIASRGRPRNHLISIIDGPVVVVPCGNLQEYDFMGKIK